MAKPTKHILIVDDDEIFRGAIERTLTREGYQVTSVAHAKVALDLLGIDPVDVVISDINMPGMSGIELMHSVRRTNPTLPVILMTGFSELKETAEAYELGARGFLPKPFQKEELLSTLEKCLVPSAAEASTPKESLENQEFNFCKLGIDDFVSGHEIKFDIYIRLSEQKFIKIAHQGENIPKDRITAYKAKNIRFLYMQKDDFKKYMGFNVSLAPLVAAKKALPLEKKLTFLKHTSEVILEHLHLAGVDEEGFQSAKTVVEATTGLLTEPDEMMNLLSILNSHSDHLYAHGLGVSMYSVLIARQMEWNSPANLYKVAMGGLLHDIGQKEIDRSILEKQRKDLTSDEVKTYETHSYRGMEILSEVSSMPSDVMQIVLQHHENCMGLGFPSRLSKNRTHPMARLVAVANEFCNLALKTAHSPGLSPTEAIHRMLMVCSDKLDPVFFTALMRVFKIVPPDGFGGRAK